MEKEVKSLNLQWWNTHISQKNTEWLEENVKGVDHHFKEMLLLIEQDGDMSVEDVNSNHLNKAELIAHAKEISLKHHSLADHYCNLTKELHSYMQSANGMQNHEGTLSLLTPNSKKGMHIVQGQVVNSHRSPSSNGGISDTSSNAYSGSSSFSSDSESESFNSSPNEQLPDQVKHKTHDAIRIEESEDYEILMRRISEYENELKVSNQKLQFAEEEIAKLKSELQKNEVVIIKMGGLEAQLVSAKKQTKSYEEHIDIENKKSSLLQREIVELEANLESEKRQVLELQENVKKCRTDLSVRDLEIKKLSAELEDASGNFALEKWELEACISKLTERLTFHVVKNEELQMEYESLADELKKCEAGRVEMEKAKEAMEIKCQKDVESLKAELHKKNENLNILNQNLGWLKQKHDILMSEKNEVSAKLQAIRAELSSRDNRIRLLVNNTFELQSEKKKLSTFCENAENEKAQLKSRIEELEKELGRQTVVISERAEEKREAIRQLCFSIDHFKGAYEELRNTYVLKKRPTAVV